MFILKRLTLSLSLCLPLPSLSVSHSSLSLSLSLPPLFFPLLPPLRRSLKTSDSQDGEKKKSKGGFLNLIKSRTSKSSDKDKSEKNQSTPAPAQTPAPVTTVPEGPSSPKASLKSQAPEPPTKVKEAKTQPTHPSQLTQPLDCSSSSDRSEELRTPDSMDEVSDGDSKGSPQGGRRYGVQVMGTGLLAEMKAKQERRTFGSHKVSTGESKVIYYCNYICLYW